ncbi:MAG TPA: alcohol dehydrogenase catalytic domain-containing protein [Thermoanaerobaculia bacterium]|nr:alcohol dehydrogenase catalytic domain-containing protein [Thermoanaerobaculia bacterium]
MTAVVKTKAASGPGATEVRTVPVPEPGPAEVLIRVLATAVCGSDKHIYQWDPSMAGMVQPPRIYGHEFCGEIVGFGPGGKRPHLEIGQYVSAEMHVTCGHCRPCRTGQRHICENTRILGVHGDGSFAQYVVVPAFNVVPLDRKIVPVRVGAFLDALGNAVHTTQVADLSGRSVAVLGYGPIGAMCAEIARISGASQIAITEVNGHAAAHARRWASERGLRNVTVIDLSKTKDAVGSLREATGGGADVVLELSGAEASVNLGLAGARRGGVLSLLGLPREKSLTIRDYTNDFIFKGLTLHAVIGRRIFETWIKMLDLLRAGLDVEHLVTDEFEGLEDFEKAMALLENRRAMKVVFYPNGKPK